MKDRETRLTTFGKNGLRPPLNQGKHGVELETPHGRFRVVSDDPRVIRDGMVAAASWALQAQDLKARRELALERQQRINVLQTRVDALRAEYQRYGYKRSGLHKELKDAEAELSQIDPGRRH
jgi:hypothetical protein